MVAVPLLQLLEIEPELFWREHISQRQPAVIQGTGDGWKDWSDDVLDAKAGAATVLVERRGSGAEAFGRGIKQPMTFGAFLRALQGSDARLYLSTQEVGVARDGHPLLYAPPLLQLAGHFPARQALMGNLVPQAINMWMGCAPKGSSSGLHHDFHDNLYVLLRGTKRFRLFPPALAARMYTAGTLRAVYPNGRIVYEGQGEVLPDGTDAHDVRRWRARRATDAAACGSDDDALETQLAAALAGEGGGAEDSSMLGCSDDYVDSDAASSGSGGGGVVAAAAPAAAVSSTPHPTAVAATRSSGCKATVVPTPSPPPLPPSFSQIDLSLPPSELRACFPEFPGLSAASEVVLSAGQMLYLPAGWFHEVTSYGGGGLDGGHLAVNYWYHPPDNLDPGHSGYTHPYTSDFLPGLWAERASDLHAQTLAWWAAGKQAQMHESTLGKQQQQQRQPQHQREQQQQQQQHPERKREHQQQQQQQQLQQLQQQRERRRQQRNKGPRHVSWCTGVRSPPNRYRMGMTRAGSAVTISRGGADDDDHGPDKGVQPSSSSLPGGEDQDAAMSPAVRAGLEALEAYFGGGADGAAQLIAEYIAQRRRRAAAAARAAHGRPTLMALPRLIGRRHHYSVAVRLAPRPRAPQ